MAYRGAGGGAMKGGGAGVGGGTFAGRPAGGGFALSGGGQPCPSNPAVMIGHPDCRSRGTSVGVRQGSGAGGGGTTPGMVNLKSKATPYVGGLPPEAASATGTANKFQEYGGGLMDPGSSLYQNFLSQFKQDIGGQAAAQMRSAALSGAESGFGGGMSPEAMQMEAAAGAAGSEATGRAISDFATKAPELGLRFGATGAGIAQGQGQMAEQSRQYGAGLNEGGRQFDVSSGLQATEIANRQKMMENEALMKMYGIAFGGL